MNIMLNIEKLERMLAVIPEHEIKMNFEKRSEAEALKAGIEALRVKAGYPPNLPGYITLAKTKHPTPKKLVKAATLQESYKNASFYLAREMHAVLKASDDLEGVPICRTTPKNCYNTEEPLIYGLPVIFGDFADLGKNIYLVAPEKI